VRDLLDELEPETRALCIEAADTLGLSMRGVARCLRVARTIAALAGRETPESDHVAEALSYRLFDRAEEPPKALRTTGAP
jgi:magnesium chelatase family protein